MCTGEIKRGEAKHSEFRKLSQQNDAWSVLTPSLLGRQSRLAESTVCERVGVHVCVHARTLTHACAYRGFRWERSVQEETNALALIKSRSIY